MPDELNKLKEEAELARQRLVESGGINWDHHSALIGGSVLLFFALLLFGMMGFLIYKGKGSPNSLMKTFTVPLILVMAAFLVITGYTNEQISPVIGLLGTVAGYLLGKSEKTTGGNDQ